MSKDFKFSIIISLFESQAYLKESLDSIINQSLNFEKYVQIILIDNGSLDKSSEIIAEYVSKYPKNILVLSKENEGHASSLNFALDYIEGEYVNFLEPNDKLSKNTLTEIYKCFSNNKEIDVATIPVCVFNKHTSEYINKYDFNKNNVVDLVKEPYLDIKFYTSFIKSDVIKEYNFDTNLIEDADELVLFNILLNKKIYGLVTTATYYYRKRNGDIRFLNDTITKRHLNEKFKLFFLSLINSSMNYENYVPKFIQHIIVKKLESIIVIEDLKDYLDTEAEIEEFWDYFYKILDVLDMEFIYSDSYLINNFKLFLIYLMNNKKFSVRCVPENSEVFFETSNYVIRKLHKTYIIFDIVDFNNGVLNFTGGINSNLNKDFSVEAVKIDQNGNETVFKAKTREYINSPRRDKKFLGILWKKYYNFDVDIPVNKNEVFEIKFRVIFHSDEDIVMYNSIKFRKFSGISNLNNYFIKNSRILSFRGKTFYSSPYSYSKMFKLEFKSIGRIIKNNESNLWTGLFYRTLRFIAFPFMKNKTIWLFMDRDVFADDNAEHLFKYAVKQDDGIKKYFVINKDSPDFKRLKKFDSHIVPFKSFKHRFLYFFADKFLSSQVTKGFMNPFLYENSYMYEGMSKHDFAFLQHGVTKDDISSWIRKYSRNIRYFVTVSDLERDSFFNGNYNYDDEVVQAVGFPRYDNLKDDSTKKEVLFIPTWRRKLDTEDQLVNSDYLKSMNSFLNNEKLINALKERNYTFVFRPHPQLWDFVHLFKIRDDIRISEEPYQEMFRDASIMITDYSSVFFDFAYLKKPIIYYHEKDDYHYKEGYFDYETMGFGEVIKNEDALVDKIIEYLDKDCKMEEKYKERVDKFFKYNDQNNCKRVYEWIKG